RSRQRLKERKERRISRTWQSNDRAKLPDRTGRKETCLIALSGRCLRAESVRISCSRTTHDCPHSRHYTGTPERPLQSKNAMASTVLTVWRNPTHPMLYTFEAHARLADDLTPLTDEQLMLAVQQESSPAL